MLWASQNDNYKAASACLERILRIPCDDSQLHRLTDDYGSLLEEQTEQLSEKVFLHNEQVSQTVKETNVVYAMADGCQLPTRPCEANGSWKEMKLGRVFSEQNHLRISGKKNVIRSSSYVAHFGNNKDFTSKFEQVVDHYEKLGEQLVFINDGAKWINDWIVSNYSSFAPFFLK